MRPAPPQRRPLRRCGDGVLITCGSALELVFRPAALTPDPVRVGVILAQKMSSRVRDLHEDPGDKLLRVDLLVIRRLGRIVSPLSRVDDLQSAVFLGSRGR